MSDDRSAKMLERVRALLAKADGTNFPEEAKTFRDKADQLMTAHAITMWQIDAVQEGVNARPEPTHRMVNIGWYWNRDSNVRDALWSMLLDVARHCRLAVVPHAVAYSEIPVVGLDADIDYFDMLFTSLHFQLSKQLEPKFNDLLNEAENIMVFKEAGLPWREIAKLIGRPEFVDNTGKVHDKGYMGRVYKKHCETNDIPMINANPKSYQRNFARGFATGVREQLQRQDKRTEDGGAGNALVLRDIRHAVNEHAQEVFGKDTRVVRYRRDSRKTDWAAREAGSVAGKKADVSGHHNRRVSNRKQIEG